MPKGTPPLPPELFWDETRREVLPVHCQNLGLAGAAWEWFSSLATMDIKRQYKKMGEKKMHYFQFLRVLSSCPLKIILHCSLHLANLSFSFLDSWMCSISVSPHRGLQLMEKSLPQPGRLRWGGSSGEKEGKCLLFPSAYHGRLWALTLGGSPGWKWLLPTHIFPQYHMNFSFASTTSNLVQYLFGSTSHLPY